MRFKIFLYRIFFSKTFLGLVLAACAMSWAHAQPLVLKVATGSCSKDTCSTYVVMFRQLAQLCSKPESVVLQEVLGAGTIDNAKKLTGNEVNAMMGQEDAMFWQSRTEDLSKVKTLFTLHPEEVHFIALATAEIGANRGLNPSSWMNKATALTMVDQLVGMKVGTVEGSGGHATARLVRAEGNVNFEVVPYANVDAMKAALDSGAVQAIVYVGGHPLPAIQELSTKYKLLSFSKQLQDTLKDRYRPARVSYGNIRAEGIATISTNANLFTRVYSQPAQLQALAAFRACAQAAVPILKDTTGTHKKWQSVDPDYQGKWAWYDLPAVAAGAAGTAPGAAAPTPAPAATRPGGPPGRPQGPAKRT